MPRNFDRRVEAVTPIEKQSLHERLRALFDMYLSDNRQAWELGSDGRWTQRVPSDIERPSHQLLMVNSWGIVEGAVGSGLWSTVEQPPAQGTTTPARPNRRRRPRRSS